MRHLIGSMPEMETKHVKTKQTGLASGGWAKSLFISHISFLHIAIWCGARNNRKRGRKGSPQKGNIIAQQPWLLAPCWQQLGAQRLGSGTMLNGGLTRFLDSQESDAFWDCWTGGKQSHRICWEVLIIWKTWQNSYDLWGKGTGTWSVPVSQALGSW